VKIEHPDMCLATMACVYAAHMGCVTILSAAVNFDQFQMLHTLTWAARSYAQYYTALKAFIQEGI